VASARPPGSVPARFPPGATPNMLAAYPDLPSLSQVSSSLTPGEFSKQIRSFHAAAAAAVTFHTLKHFYLYNSNPNFFSQHS
jgi:hypothetical protein